MHVSGPGFDNKDDRDFVPFQHKMPLGDGVVINPGESLITIIRSDGKEFHYTVAYQIAFIL